MIKISLPGEPIAKMRPKFSRKGTYDPQHSIKHAAKFQVLSQLNGRNPFPKDVAIDIEINFYFHCPSHKLSLLHWGIMDHVEKPDIDNCEKWICDILNGIIYEDDKQIINSTCHKIYSDDPRTEILIMPKKPDCSDKVKEVLSIVSPSQLIDLSVDLSHIADTIHVCHDVDYEEVAFLILEFSEKHADNLKKINKKFPGLATVLRERMESK